MSSASALSAAPRLLRRQARGQRVLGLERGRIPNQSGSPGGVDRMIHLAHSADPRYVPLLRRAFERWRQLKARSGERFLGRTGRVDAVPPDSENLTGSLESCHLHELGNEPLDAA
jgi:sarcosine oxidase